MKVEDARRVLEARLGAPVHDVVKVVTFELDDGRQIALEKERIAGTLYLWCEREPEGWWLAHSIKIKREYGADERRNHSLPPRLDFRRSASVTAAGGPRPLLYVSARNAEELDVLLTAYAGHGRYETMPTTKMDTAMPTNRSEETSKPTNLILYGPPGTGKTFATVRRAVALCDKTVDLKDRAEVEDRFKELNEAPKGSCARIEFVTFHQTYGYEDFVEGLRPPSSENEGTEAGNASQRGFRLEPTDGIFKKIAEAAGKSANAKAFDAVREDGSPSRVWKMALGRGGAEEHIYDECLEEGQVALGWGDPADWSDARFDSLRVIKDEWHAKIDEEGKESRKLMLDYFRNEMKEGDLVVISKGSSRFRAIMQVTGPYEYDEERRNYRQRRDARTLWWDKDGSGIDKNAIRSGGSDFGQDSITRLHDVDIERLRHVVDGSIEQHVLIIDEINRANVSKVFGELITLLEPDKRAGKDHELSVRLPFSRDPFTVPPNLHVIGTMNTADRSIALLDTALRRRFEFEEVMPDPDVLKEENVEGRTHDVKLEKVLTAINDRVEYLFDRDHTIGHSYLMGCKTRSDVDRAMLTKVIPLLVEYFHEDWEKVRTILGERKVGEGKGDAGNFIRRTVLQPPPGMDGEARHRYEIRETVAEGAYDALTKGPDEPKDETKPETAGNQAASAEPEPESDPSE